MLKALRAFFLLVPLQMAIAIFAAAGMGTKQAGVIRPGFDATAPHWNDTQGNRIEAHAAGLLQAEDGSWYWYGESKKTSSLADHGVNAYRAETLAGPWTRLGQVFAQQDLPPTLNGQKGPFVLERPKVLFNEATKKYVMWMHLDSSGYSFRHAGVAISASPSGPFTFLHALQPDGIPSLDMNLWRDPFDGTAYFIRSCDNQYAGISRLTADYLNTTGIISKMPRLEGMAFFRLSNGTYFLISSHLTGWNPNPLMLYRANGKTLDDPQWVDLGNPTGDQTSFNTQVGRIDRRGGKKKKKKKRVCVRKKSELA